MRLSWLKSAALAAAFCVMACVIAAPVFAQSDTAPIKTNSNAIISASEETATLPDAGAAATNGAGTSATPSTDEGATQDAPDATEQTEPKAAAPPPEPTLEIDIDLSNQRMRVTEDGGKRYFWAVSSGAYGYPTPTGTFRPVWMSKMWYSRKYDYAPMPNAIFFHGGAAIHATSSVGTLGRPASHGCVRLAPSNAATLYKMVGKHGKERTRIVVHGTPNYRSAPVAQRTTPYPRYAYAFPYYRAPAGTYFYPGDPPPQYYAPRNRRLAAPPGYYGYYGMQRRYVVRQYRQYQGYGYGY